MKKIKKIITAILPVVMLVAGIGGLIYWTKNSENALVNNPLIDSTKASHELLSPGGNLSVSQDLLGDSADKKTDSDEENSENSRDDKNDDSSDSSSRETKGESQQIIENYISENYYKISKNDDYISGNGNGADLGTGSSKGKENSNIYSADSDNGEEKSIEISGDTQQDILDDEDKKNYFSTTIKDGEKVTSRHYSFEITHNYPELDVDSLEVYVNENLQVQFNGNVLLNEGQNKIRIAVKYKDSNGKVIAVAKKYTVEVELGNIKIETSLSDFSTKEESITFKAKAVYNDIPLELNVNCNGKRVDSSNENFTIHLNEGNNKIILWASRGEQKKTLEFNVSYIPNKPCDIETSLEIEQIVHDDKISFTARIINGSGKGTLTAYINNTRIKDNKENKYSCNLNVGNNVIRLKAIDKIDGQKTVLNKTYVVRVVPIVTEETEPYFEKINITDKMTVKGNDFVLNILARDYTGEQIYQNGISVNLNGYLYKYTWASKYISYKLWFENGENDLKIRLTDKDGRYKDFSYKIYCTEVEDGKKIGTITFSLDANTVGLGYLIEPIKVDIHQGENLAKVLKRVVEEKGFNIEYGNTLDEGFYLSRIVKPNMTVSAVIPEDLVQSINKDGLEWTKTRYNNSLGAFDFCQGSGWMYSVNEDYTNFSMADYMPKDEDVVKVRYTLAYGNDIGGYRVTGSVGGNIADNYDKVW